MIWDCFSPRPTVHKSPRDTSFFATGAQKYDTYITPEPGHFFRDVWTYNMSCMHRMQTMVANGCKSVQSSANDYKWHIVFVSAVGLPERSAPARRPCKKPRLFGRDLQRESAVESASFLVGYLLGLPCCAFAPTPLFSLTPS